MVFKGVSKGSTSVQEAQGIARGGRSKDVSGIFWGFHACSQTMQGISEALQGRSKDVSEDLRDVLGNYKEFHDRSEAFQRM